MLPENRALERYSSRRIWCGAALKQQQRFLLENQGNANWRKVGDDPDRRVAYQANSLISLARPTGIEPVFPP
jgi:hypothetical protein